MEKIFILMHANLDECTQSRTMHRGIWKYQRRRIIYILYINMNSNNTFLTVIDYFLDMQQFMDMD